ncbi:MAG: ABC transporter ATP-binding protein [Planctomycetes bacterium]|nr:ABC transporter ATP-binding protein [Planctomycetota bacterium]
MPPPAFSPHEEDRLAAPLDRRLALRLLRYGLPYRGWMALAVLLVLLVTGLDLAGPLIVKQAIDGPLRQSVAGASTPLPGSGGGGAPASSTASSPMRQLAAWAALYGLVVALYVSLRYGQGLLMSSIGQKIMRDLRLEIFTHLQRMPMSFFNRNPVGRLVTRVTNDVEALNQLFTSGVVTFVADVVVLSSLTLVLFWINLRLALVTLAVVPFLLLATFVFRFFARKYYREQRGHLAHLNAFTQESIQGMDTIQLFVQEAENLRRFAAINGSYLDAFQKTVFCYSVYFPVIEILGASALACILWQGGDGIRAGTLTFGEFYLFWSFLGRFLNPIRDMAERYNVLQSAMASAERIFRVLDSPQTIRSREAAVRPARLRGEVEFKEVSFSYDSPLPPPLREGVDSPLPPPLREGVDADFAVRDLSFRVEPGETVAIVGATGAGKSTVINLLTRFYDPQRGRILIDGLDLRDYHKQALRRRIAVVLQDPFLFSRTVLENIRLGNPEISAEAAMEAARRMQAHRFIERLPQKHEETLKERGLTLSLGERQLLSFARAMAHRPDLLILDEATAHVDTETEKLIQAALQELWRGRTSIIIAHRLSTVQRANRILVLHKGLLREAGTHDELLKQRGIYHRLYQLQFLGK